MTYTHHTNISTLNNVQKYNYYELMHNVALNAIANNEYLTCVYDIVTCKNEIVYIIAELALANDSDFENVEQFVYTNNGLTRCTFDDFDF